MTRRNDGVPYWKRNRSHSKLATLLWRKNISYFEEIRGNPCRFTSSSIFNGGELWIARYLLCSLRKSCTKFGGKFLEKKRREREERLFEEMVGYGWIGRGGSNKFSLHYWYVQRKPSRFEKHDGRMVNRVTTRILRYYIVVGGSFLLAEF